ncbi:MAG: hypothetical protein JNN15_00420 [Blastocatellia bacterium]|nr:hypothetical protein [Blastocatellia bacterium]
MEKSDSGIKDMFKQGYEIWEKSVSEQLEKIARSQTFVAAIAQNLEQTLNLSGRIKDVTQTTLSMMNLPTKRDIDNLTKQVKALRASVEEMNEKLDKMSAVAKKTSTQTEAKATTKSSKGRKKKAQDNDEE